jgi:hypothetical protein
MELPFSLDLLTVNVAKSMTLFRATLVVLVLRVATSVTILTPQQTRTEVVDPVKGGTSLTAL